MNGANDDDDVSYLFDAQAKMHFTEEGRRLFTGQERGQLEELHAKLREKFDEICNHIAAKLVGPTHVEQIIEEAEEAIENWDAEVESSSDPEQWDKAAKPDPELQTLLAEHHAVSEDIMNIRDAAVERSKIHEASSAIQIGSAPVARLSSKST
jgi:hypothetical protein